MLSIDIPGGPGLRLSHLVLDYNGTLAFGGALDPAVPDLLRALAGSLAIEVVTADTFGAAAGNLRDLPASLIVLGPEGQARAKLRRVEALGPEGTAAIGNGANDRLMVARAALGVAVIGPEGAAGATVAAADVVCPTIASALGLLLNPLRLVATLRT